LPNRHNFVVRGKALPPPDFTFDGVDDEIVKRFPLVLYFSGVAQEICGKSNG